MIARVRLAASWRPMDLGGGRFLIHGITNAQRSKLEELGYAGDQIAKMKPAEAHGIFKIGTRLQLEPSRASSFLRDRNSSFG